MRGFTLLEVLISITILVIITGIVYSTFSSNITAVEIAREQSIANQTARVILDQMTKEFESAYLLQEDDDQDISSLGMVGINRKIDGKPADTINFTTLCGAQVSQNNIYTDLREVGYSVEPKEEDQTVTDDEEGKNLLLMRREDNFLDGSITEGGSIYQMADNIAELDITYRDTKGNEFEAWNSLDGDQAGVLPDLITIRLVIREKSGRENVYSTAVHPMLANNSK